MPNPEEVSCVSTDPEEPELLYCMRVDWHNIGKDMAKWIIVSTILFLVAVIAAIMGSRADVLGLLFGMSTVTGVAAVAFVIGRHWRWDVN